MSSIGLLEILLALVLLVVLLRLGNNNGLPTSWPIVGMLPAVVAQVHRINDWVTGVLLQTNCNFLFRGPWFSNMSEILVTVDPPNIHYIMSANFANFPKGSEFKSIFDILGDGIFNSDSDVWKDQRKIAVALISNRKFYKFLLRTSKDKVKNGLIRVLDYASERGLVLDLQDLFQRFTFDSTCRLVTGFDPGCLSTEFPDVPFARAMDDALRPIFYRHVFPEFVWKLQRWLGIGEEKKLMRAWKTFDHIIGEYIKEKREELRRGPESRLEEDGTDLLASYMTMNKDEMLGLDCKDDRFLRDTILNLLLAGRDTTSSGLAWFFWNLSRNPSVEKKIREEIDSVAEKEEIGPSSINKLVYLHGAICESLRLYPPVPWQHKRPAKPDVLPSGHRVGPETRIMFNLYAMGRMPSIWGKDSFEFKPERWISDRGGIKHEPSYKFLAFNAGPRTCLGKEVAFAQMKTVAAAVIRDFHIEVVEGQDVRPCNSVILHMKNGLRVRVLSVSRSIRAE